MLGDIRNGPSKFAEGEFRRVATINGTAGNDTLSGTDVADSIFGLDGDDILDGGLGADRIYGDNGNDIIKFSAVRVSSPAPIAIGLLDGGDGFDELDWSNVSPVQLGTMQNSSGQYVLSGTVGSQKFEIKNIERIKFGSRDDSIIPASTAGGLEIWAGGGNDTIFLNPGDKVQGESGNDRMFLSGAFGGQQKFGLADGGEGTDLLQLNIAFKVDLAAGTAAAGNAFYAISGFEDVQMYMYSDRAEGYGDDKPNTMTVIDGSGSSSAGVLFDGRGGDDKITGSSAADIIRGGSGNDELRGEAGNDSVVGGSGDDSLSGGAGNDTLDGGLGSDRASYSGLYRSYGATASLGTVTIRGNASEGTDTITSIETVLFQDGVLQSDPDAAFAKILRVYDTVLGRAPDALGLDFYVDRMEDLGWTLSQVADDLTRSVEFQTVTGGLSNAAFVDYVYIHALGRSPDAGGATYYTGVLDGGASRGSFVIDLSESAEHRSLTAAMVADGFFNTDDTYQSVALLYDGFAGRAPDVGGLTYYAENIKAGKMTIAQVVADFAGSAEFKANVAGKTNGQIVDFIYENTLNRLPDTDGRAFYTGEMDKGASAAVILQDVALSAEHYNLYAAHIVQGIDFI